ncbi:MAG: UDP-glucose/GDP-mannose dehydrogenase family protein [Rikenellaceae bacterium]|nr:UDP-glucose/GDP-mannose dehydrogenase family protein [Rikenellaceae bacterium]
MNIAIVGTGYVGLVTGACFAEMGLRVTCVDIDRDKIEMLSNGIMPIYEPGLKELVEKNTRENRLFFSTNLTSVLPEVDIVFNAVGTPPDEDGSADLSYVYKVAEEFGKYITRYTLFVTKSTVPVGTSKRVKEIIKEELRTRGQDIPFDVASNPEFLKEGAAIEDFMKPDRVVVGTNSPKARLLMEKVYRPFMMNNYRMIFTDISSAEMIKYAANAMLATRISFMNDIANLCEIVGADVDMVRTGIGADQRIGNKFLYAGCGYGGSCFPKDVKALASTGRQNGYVMEVIEAVDRVNDRQKTILFDKLNDGFGGDIAGKTIAVWGLAFKPETDDVREAPAIKVIEKLLEAGTGVKVYDPVAMEETEKLLGDKIVYSSDMYAAAENADAVMLMTEWKQFRLPNWKKVRKIMNGSHVLDGRNIYDREELEQLGFTYYRIGG